MMKIAVVVDSTAYLSPAYVKEHNITVLPLSISFDNETYKELVDINIDDFYKKLKKAPELPTSSQPSVGEVEATFNKLAKDYDQILALTLSSDISGTFNTFVSVGQTIEDAEVYVFDSRISARPEAFLVEAAVRMIENGADIDTVIPVLSNLQKSQATYFIVDDLNHLKRGGRLNATSAMVGGILKIKPILVFENGGISIFEKIRTMKKAKNRLIELFDEAYAKSNAPLKVSVFSTPNVLDADELIETLRIKYPEVSLDRSIIGPVIGTHIGPGTIAMTWIIDDEKM